MIEKRDCVLILEYAKSVVVSNNFAEGAVFVKCAGFGTHDRSEENFKRSMHQANAENRSFFHLGMSRPQHTWILRSCSMAFDQTSLFLGSVATPKRSTTVVPRVRSLETSISTKCLLDEVQSVGSSAMPMVTGSGSAMPL